MATRNKRICLVAGAAILVALLGYLGWYSWYRLTTSPLRLALPRGSTEVTDLYEDFGFSPDYSYYLKAKLPSMKSFTQYCSDMNLTPHTEQRIYSDSTTWLSWRQPCISRPPYTPIAWWKPSSSLSGTFVRQGGHGWVMAKYEDGYLYVKAISH